jgi:hypothetical protein
MVRFTPDFELLPGTRTGVAAQPPAKEEPLSADAPADTSGG